jgi:hypothetical protein
VYGGFQPLSGSLGFFVSPTVALLARTSGTAYFKRDDLFTNSFLGPAVQVWPTDRVMLGLGAGLGVHGPNRLFSRSLAVTRTGLAFSVRAGYALRARRDDVLRLGVELVPTFTDRDTVLGTAVTLEWQWL